MEVIPSRAGGSGSIPFQRHNVEEWSRLDSLTGMLEHARVEAGHWAANTSTSSQQYGKVVDSRARNLADGSVQQRKKKQLEVFQAQVPGGSLQVIRTQSVTSTSSWGTPLHCNTKASADFENLQLALNPLDLSSQKTKASVGRSGSIGGRRPPSRPRSIISKVDSAISEENSLLDADKEDVDQRLSEVSRICRQIHEEAKRNTSNSLLSPGPPSSLYLSSLNDDVNRRDCIDDSRYGCIKSDKWNSLNAFNTCTDKGKKADEIGSNGLVHTILTRKKSCSTEDLQNNDHHEKDKLSEGNEKSADLIRTLGVRRSLQLPHKGNRLDIPNGNVTKLRKELEDRKTVDTMKNNTSSFEAFENIFRYGTDSAINTSLLKEHNRQACSINSLIDKSENGHELEGFSRRVDSNKGSPHKRHSFVTVESLKEVRGRLRRLCSPPLDGVQHPTKDMEGSDDGIVTEDTNKAAPGMELVSTEEVPTSRVKSYVYGMEATTNNRSNVRTAGTGSLESRTSNRSSSSGGSRSEEWYNRRKSYGFEQVHQQDDNHSEPMAFREKSRVESSTDSGICRSSETVTPSSWSPFNREKANNQITHGNLKINHNIQIKQLNNDRKLIETENRGTESNYQKGRRTVVTLGSDNDGNRSGLHMNGSNMRETSSMTISNSWRSGYDSKATSSMTTNVSAKSVRRLSEPVTVTIPIVPDDAIDSIDGSGTIDARPLYLRQFSEGKSLSVENGWRKSGTLLTNGNESPQNNLSDELKTVAARRELLLKHSGGSGWSHPSKQTDIEIKRHSIAVDESKYVRESLKSYNLCNKRIGPFNFENGFRTTPASIADFERSIGLNASNKEEVMPLHKELEYKMSTSAGMSRDVDNSKPASFNFENDDDDGDDFSLQHYLAGKKHKKVEFCKTEVHFAAEPGRFNIVETDEKPPPNNIRRRRRSSGAILATPQIQDANKTNLPEIRFGDSPYEKKLLGGTESNIAPCQIAVSLDSCNKSDLDQSEPIMPTTSSSFQDDADKEDNIFTQANATILSSVREESVEIGVHNNDEDVCADSIFLQQNSVNPSSPSNARPRSILKNNRKPRPFHLGDTDEGILVSSSNEKSERSSGDPEAKWGVRLKPVQNRESSSSSTSMWRSTVMLHNPTFGTQKQQNYSPSLMPQEERVPSTQSLEEGVEQNKLLKFLRPPFQRKSANDTYGAPRESKTQSAESVGGGMEVKISTTSPWSVAERVRQVEDMKHVAPETRGYSTRVNFGAGEATVIESGSSDDQQKQSMPASPMYQQNNHPKPIWLRREERKQEAMEHCDIKRQTASDKGLVVHIGKNGGSNSEDGHGSLDTNMRPENYSRTEDIKSRNVKTTTILIDLSPISSDNCVSKVGPLEQEMQKISVNEKSGKSTGTLRSPSLIMKTINKSSQIQESGVNEREGSMHNMQENERTVRNNINRQTEVVGRTPVPTPRTKKMNFQPQKYTNRFRGDLCAKTVEKNTSSKLLIQKSCVKTQVEEGGIKNMMVVPNQLTALKELYYSAELSDDSERADEEVRSYMSGGGDEDDRDQDEDSSSVVSGSWSRMRAFRNIQHHFHKFNTSHKDHADGSPMLKLDSSRDPSFQRSVTEAKLQSYNDSSRLRSVETLVSTRSGHPKITSISLRYEGEQNMKPLTQDYDRNPDSARYQARFRSLPSSRNENLHITESVKPINFGVNTSSVETSAKSYNKPLFTQQKGNTNSSKSVYTQKEKELPSSFVKSTFQAERQTSQFTTVERNYENLNPRSPVKKNNDSVSTGQITSSLPAKKAFHPEHEDKFMSYQNHNKCEFSPKSSIRQESEPPASSDRRLPNNRRSLSPVTNKTIHQEKKQSPSPVLVQQRASGSSNSSDFISSRRNSSDKTRKERLNIREEDTKKEDNFRSKLLNEKCKDIFIYENEGGTQDSGEYKEKEKRSSRMKTASSVSTKHNRSPSPVEVAHSRRSKAQAGFSGRKMTASPLYENVRMLSAELAANPNGQISVNDPVETESTILEELTRAADQILQAVNGYTDEESYRASSDEPDDDITKDGRRRRGKRCGQVRRPSASLGTITEAPSSKKQQENSTLELNSHKSTGNTRKNQRLTRARLGPTSSTSSVESVTREISRAQTRALKQEGSSSVNDHNKSKVVSSSPSSMPVRSGSRTARLLQRASSRELLLQTYASSSEDVASGVEGGNSRKPAVPRRMRAHSSNTNKTDPAKINLKRTTVSSDSQPSPSAKARPRKRDADTNKPKERFAGSTNKMVPVVRKSSGGDSGSPLRNSRTREEERHQRSSSRPTARRDHTDSRHRAQGGVTTALEPRSRDKTERTTVYERRVMGPMGGVSQSSTSCVVTKKKPSLASSQNKGLVQTKATK